MAIGHPSIISGKIGPIVACYIKASKKTIYRAAPRKYKQTNATIAAQSSFGMASTAGKILRRQLVSILPFPKDKLMQSRFSGAISSWLKTNKPEALGLVPMIPGLGTFAFNVECPLDRRWKLDFSWKADAAGNLVIVLPAFIPAEKLSVPAGTSRITCKLAVASVQLAAGKDAGKYETSFDIPWLSPDLPQVELNTGLSMDRGNLVVAGARLIYYKNEHGEETADNREAFMPSGLFAAIYC